MANVLKHRFASGKADGPDAAQVQPSHWNDGHLFSGGVAGDVLTRDPTDASFGAKWTTPFPLGQWTAVPFSAANFSGIAPLFWTVGSAAMRTNRYARAGNILFWQLYMSWFSGSNVLSGSPGTTIRITSPLGLTLGVGQQQLIDYCQGTAGVPIASGLMITTNLAGAIDITKVAGGNFALSDIPGFNTIFTLEIT